MYTSTLYIVGSMLLVDLNAVSIFSLS